jgi:cell wall-associated NlpC family hydrolase
MNSDDARLNAGRGEAEGTLKQCRVPKTSIRKLPRFDAPQLSEALMGEVLRVFDDNEGWSFAQSARDRYVGFLSSDDLGEVTATTHKVAVPSTFIYPAPSIKSQPAQWLPMLAEVTVRGEEAGFARLADGRFVYGTHLAPLASREGDYVAIAERFLSVPYYWGGKTAQGLDCSGLVQVALQASGVPALRDSDMQEEQLGRQLMVNDLDGLARGDLVFWDGHVGIMVDNLTLLHANGFHMQVVKEPLKEAVARIKASGKDITHIKRL